MPLVDIYGCAHPASSAQGQQGFFSGFSDELVARALKVLLATIILFAGILLFLLFTPFLGKDAHAADDVKPASTTGATTRGTTHSISVVLGIHQAPLVFAPGTTRAQIVKALEANYGQEKASFDSFVFVVDGKEYALSKSERELIAPEINFALIADQVIKSSREIGVVTDANEMAALKVDKDALDELSELYAEKTSKPKRDAGYTVNKKESGLKTVKPRDGLSASAKDFRDAFYTALKQFALQGYQGSVTARNVERSQTKADTEIGMALFVSRAERKLTIYENGEKTRSYAVTIGMPAWPTPRGDFTIGPKTVNPLWRNPGSSWAKDMPDSVPGLMGVRALHLMWVPSGHDSLIRFHGQNGPAGQAASHGCIRLSNPQVIELYNLVPTGTPVFVR
jgi:lipoprotein-anchoring transpeptidase ErfK/SrfK